MSEDPWAAWQPTANPAARGNEVYQARRALSRDLSAGPMSPPRAKQSGSLYDRGAPSLPGPSTRASGRQPLPDQSFPARGGGPSRSGAGWQRSPPRGHLDHGWASRTGHEEPIAKPLIVGDIESATNAPLTEEQLRDVREKRSSRDDLHERASGRAVDSSRDVERYESSTRRRDRSRDGSSERHRGGLYERDRRKRPRLEDDDRERRTSRRRSRSRSRSRSRERRERESTRESIRDRDRRRHEERRDRHRDDRDGSRAHTSVGTPQRNVRE